MMLFLNDYLKSVKMRRKPRDHEKIHMFKTHKSGTLIYSTNNSTVICNDELRWNRKHNDTS